jgi:hypothetical protein
LPIHDIGRGDELYAFAGRKTPFPEDVTNVDGVALEVDEAFVAPGLEIDDVEVGVADLYADGRVRGEVGELFDQFVSHHQKDPYSQ